MALPTKCLLFLFMIIVVHGHVVVDIEQKVNIDGCCNGCCPCNSCGYQCKDDVAGKCRKECHIDEIVDPVGCETKNGKDCDLKCCVVPDRCWNPMTKEWVKNGTIVDFGGCTCEICIVDYLGQSYWVPDPDVILDRCLKCRAFGEPHIKAFTVAQFAWHVPCIHALAQGGFSMAPPFGVFMKFEPLVWDRAFASIGPTTYTEGGINVNLEPNQNPVKVRVGTGPYVSLTTTPTLLGTTVWAWMKNGCIKIYGEQKMLIKLCPWQITIWTPELGYPVWPLYPGPGGYPLLGGLCSSNGLIGTSELVARNDAVSVSTNINSLCTLNYGLNWQEEPQPGLHCPATNITTSDLQEICETNTYYRHRCQGIVARSGLTGPEAAMYIEACMFDFCVTEEPGSIEDMYEQMTEEARTEQINTIDCCQDTTCTDQLGTCVPNYGTPNPICNPAFCSGEDCTCCP